MSKSATAFRTISEVAELLGVPKHVLRFWEIKFPQIKPMKRGGGRRYYRPEDLELLRGIRHLLHAEGYTIKGVQKILREQGVDTVKSAPPDAKVSTPITTETEPAAEATAQAKTSKRSRGTQKTKAGKTAHAAASKSSRTSSPLTDNQQASAAVSEAHMRLSERAVEALHQALKELEACRADLIEVHHPAVKSKAGKRPGTGGGARAATPRKKQPAKAARA
ncbi:MAG: MerR family transcriptional regulator [Pseudomonadota bacterium]